MIVSHHEPTWLILMLLNSITFRGRDLFSSFVFPTFFSSWDDRPDFTGLVSFDLLLDDSSGCSIESNGSLFEEDMPDEWACKTSSVATDSATVSSHVLSKEDVLLNSGAELPITLDGTSDSFVVWLHEEEASLLDGPFLTRLAPAVVETFQTSCSSGRATSTLASSTNYLFCLMRINNSH